MVVRHDVSTVVYHICGLANVDGRAGLWLVSVWYVSLAGELGW